MKTSRKVTSVILTLFLIISTVAFDFSAFAQETEDDIQSFVNESRDLLLYETEPVFTTSSVDEEGTDIDFSSCRLIMKSTKKPDELNSVGIADGFKDYYIIQFKNEIDVREAYKYYLEEDYVTSVCVDEDIELLFDTQESDSATSADVPVYDGVPDRLNSWGAEVIGAYAVKDYLENNQNIIQNKVTVAVIDSGINFNHEYFSDKQHRLEKTGVDATGESDSELDNIVGHGTAVTGVILDTTPDNVIVRNYKIIDENESGVPMTALANVILQMIIDKVDIVNCSFTYSFIYKTIGTEMLSDAYKAVYDNDITIVCAAGNYINDSYGGTFYTYPTMLDCVISVTGIVEDFSPTFSLGNCVDVSAPAVNIPCAYLNDYEFVDGTSFASPLTASICAQILSVYPNYTPDTLIDILKETATPYDERVDLGDIKNMWGVGVVDAVAAIGIQRPNITANLTSGKYNEEINVEFSSGENNKIYYSLDYTYPTPETGVLYTEPIKVYATQELVNAVAYDENGVPSAKFSSLYRSTILEDENNFEIDENGTITKYNGNLVDVTIPDTINGIEVKNIAMEAFQGTGITGVSLPNTITTLGNCPGYSRQDGSFRENETLTFIDGESVEEISYCAFRGCKSLGYIDFPNVKELKPYAFAELPTMITQLKLPKVEYISGEAFRASSFIYLYLPKLQTCKSFVFDGAKIYNLYCPKLRDSSESTFYGVFGGMTSGSPLDLPEVENIYSSTFRGSVVKKGFCKRVEFSKLTSLMSIPDAYSSLVIPSTTQTFIEDTSEYEQGAYGSEKETYKFYGSAGTKVEEWANEHGFPFIEITQETAVATDLPKYYKPYMGKLEVDVIGFNRQYQWFANDVNSNEGGTPIEGATEKTFDPATCPNAKYYYCEVTSTDGDLDPITIKTSACENRMNVAVEEEKSCITNVTYEPSRETRNTFTVTVDNRPTMIQFIEPDSGTRTYDRNNKNVSIKSYDANGNEVNSLDRNLAYEVWDIYSNMSTGVEIKARAKYLNEAIYTWDKVTYNFTVELLPLDGAVRSVTPAAESGRFGAVETVVVTGPDAEAIRFKMENGTTTTYYANKATVLDNGDLQFVGKAWANNLGVNIIKVEVKVNGKWQYATEFDYEANDYPITA